MRRTSCRPGPRPPQKTPSILGVLYRAEGEASFEDHIQECAQRDMKAMRHAVDRIYVSEH